MPGVRLLFPVNVSISPLDASGALRDPVTREPILQPARGALVTLPAQIGPIQREALTMMGAGAPTAKTTGYIVVLRDDCEAASYEPRIGDKLQITGDAGIYYVWAVTPHAHKLGINQTWHLDFEDRAPAKKAGIP